nr:MAG TPA: hypothetical protein [Caudoviricetes sp.]
MNISYGVGVYVAPAASAPHLRPINVAMGDAIAR